MVCVELVAGLANKMETKTLKWVYFLHAGILFHTRVCVCVKVRVPESVWILSEVTACEIGVSLVYATT